MAITTKLRVRVSSVHHVCCHYVTVNGYDVFGTLYNLLDIQCGTFTAKRNMRSPMRHVIRLHRSNDDINKIVNHNCGISSFLLIRNSI